MLNNWRQLQFIILRFNLHNFSSFQLSINLQGLSEMCDPNCLNESDCVDLCSCRLTSATEKHKTMLSSSTRMIDGWNQSLKISCKHVTSHLSLSTSAVAEKILKICFIYGNFMEQVEEKLTWNIAKCFSLLFILSSFSRVFLFYLVNQISSLCIKEGKLRPTFIHSSNYNKIGIKK